MTSIGLLSNQLREKNLLFILSYIDYLMFFDFVSNFLLYWELNICVYSQKKPYIAVSSRIILHLPHQNGDIYIMYIITY